MFTYGRPAGVLSEHVNVRSADFSMTDKRGEKGEKTLSLFLFKKFLRKALVASKRHGKLTHSNHACMWVFLPF